jgi:hypothetical protein
MAGSPWVDGLTFAQVLESTVRRWPDGEAMVFPQLGYRCRWREFAEEVERAARSLLALGVQPQEHIGIWATNWPQWVILQFATATVGAVLVNINPAYRSHELEYVLNQAEITTLFLTDRFKQSDYFAILAELCPELHQHPLTDRPAVRCPRLRRVVSIQSSKLPGMYNWQEFLALADRVSPEAGSSACRIGSTSRRGEYPVHLWHHRLPERCNANAPKFADERLLRRRAPGHDRKRPTVHTCPILSLFRLRYGYADVRHLWNDDGDTCRGI